MSEPAPLLAGVMGWPIAHSRSPILHGHWLKRYGICGHYIPIAVPPANFEAAINALPVLGFRGINITIPYKEKIISLADAVTDRAALIGAANTITFRPDGTLHADNTDGAGFLDSVHAAVPEWRPDHGPAVVLGAGGAARAIISALLSSGAPEILVTNRTRQKAEMLAEQFGGRMEVVDWSKASDAFDGAHTIINTTALGMVGKPALPVTFQCAPATALAVDIVYAPLDTVFLKNARKAGLQTVDGLGMLLHQAVPGFESWFGMRPTVDEKLRQIVLGA